MEKRKQKQKKQKKQYASQKKERKGKELYIYFSVKSSSAEAVVWRIVN